MLSHLTQRFLLFYIQTLLETRRLVPHLLSFFQKLKLSLANSLLLYKTDSQRLVHLGFVDVAEALLELSLQLLSLFGVEHVLLGNVFCLSNRFFLFVYSLQFRSSLSVQISFPILFSALSQPGSQCSQKSSVARTLVRKD